MCTVPVNREIDVRAGTYVANRYGVPRSTLHLVIHSATSVTRAVTYAAGHLSKIS